MQVVQKNIIDLVGYLVNNDSTILAGLLWGVVVWCLASYSGCVFFASGVQKMLCNVARVWYCACVMAKTAMIGFDSLENVGGRTATSLFLAVFLRPMHGIALSLGGDVRGALCPPVPTFRSVNPHIAALFAFDSAMGGQDPPNVGALP